MISRSDKVLMTGSCFSTEVGSMLKDSGYDVCLNPFGILFNPSSIASALCRLETARHFSMNDVILRTDDASKDRYSYVSFSHHGSFARQTAEDFLENANSALESAARFFAMANVCILTFGTAWVFRHKADGEVVANCHKLPAREFSREKMTVEEIVALYSPLLERHPEKKWIFTVSPIRHLADGLHGNQTSKSVLLLAIDRLQQLFPANTVYFPSYEIMIDELRDYRYYGQDGVHPTQEAVKIIFEKFIAS